MSVPVFDDYLVRATELFLYEAAANMKYKNENIKHYWGDLAFGKHFGDFEFRRFILYIKDKYKMKPLRLFKKEEPDITIGYTSDTSCGVTIEEMFGNIYPNICYHVCKIKFVFRKNTRRLTLQWKVFGGLVCIVNKKKLKYGSPTDDDDDDQEEPLKESNSIEF